jgi:DNA-binding CsgD family transcriptional regulator
VGLSDREHRAVLELVGDANGAQGLDELRETMLAGIPRMVPADFTSYNELVSGRPTFTRVEPTLPEWAYEAWGRLAGENPLIRRYARTRDSRPYRWSDVDGIAELRRGPIFTEIYGRLGLSAQVAFALPSPPELVIGVALSRSRRDFSASECEMLDLARPHLIQAYRNAQLRDRLVDLLAAAEAGAEGSGLGVAAVSDGEVTFVTPTAAGAGGLRAGEPPPPEMLDGAATSTLRRDGELVLVRRHERGEAEFVLTFERAGRAFSRESLAGLGLTPRESDVLACFAAGTDSAAAAAELGMTVGTLHKHSRAIHAKLGVRSRAEAVATAWSAAGAATPHE